MTTRLITCKSNNEVEYAVSVLKQGGLVVFPTETVYGLGALMSDHNAVKKIYDIKNRNENKPVSVLISDVSQIEKLAETGLYGSAIERLAKKFWPGPLTLVLPKKETVPDLLTAGHDTIGIRMPDHGFALSVIKACGEPVATTSANISGEPPAVTARDALAAFDGKVDLIVDGGPCTVKSASTVAALSLDGITVLREGIITQEQLTEAAGY